MLGTWTMMQPRLCDLPQQASEASFGKTQARLYAQKAEALEERGMNGSLAIGIIAIAVAIPTGSSMAQDRDRLEGWGPFKFSMSRVQAIEAIKPSAYFYGSPFIGYDTEIDGAMWHAVVELSDDQSAITKIRLQQGTIASLMGQSKRGSRVRYVQHQ